MTVRTPRRAQAKVAVHPARRGGLRGARWGLAVASTLLAGCAGTWKPPDLAGIYNRSAQHHGPERNAIVVIPGLTGSNLVDGASGRVVWGTFAGDYVRPNRPEDLRLLAVPMRLDATLDELRDEVRPDGVLDRVRVRALGIPVVVRAYVQILAALGAGGYADESLGLAGAVDYGTDHYTCFQFDYDWRRDNVENARRLARFLEEKRAQVRAENLRRFGKEGNPRFDVVAHSMGALLLRYYLRFGDADLPADGSTPPVTWAGAPWIDRAVLVAPPNAGSLLALENLVEGYDPGPFVPRYPPALLGTFPAVYQLLPRARHGAVVEAGDPDRPVADLYDPGLWKRMGWGLASSAAAPALATLLAGVDDPALRQRIALDHLAKSLARARHLAAALDQPAPPPPSHLELYLVAGDAVPTPRRLAAEAATGDLHLLDEAPGDGTVLRSSALLDEREGATWGATLRSPISWTQTLFLFTDHLGLTRDPIFTDNVLFWLLERPAAASEDSPSPLGLAAQGDFE